MPPAIIPIVGAVAGGVVSSVVGAAIGGGIVGTIIGSLAGGAVAVGVSYLGAGGKPKLSNPASSFTSTVQGGGRTQMVRQPITAHKIIYGETRVSGPMVFIHSRPIDSSSAKLDILHLVVVLAAHEVEQIGNIYFTDVVVPLDGAGAANAVKGAFVSPDHQWQPTDYPEVSVEAYQTQDGGEYTSSTLDLPFTQSPTMAQRIARIALEQNRRQKALSFPANLSGFRVSAGDNISIDLPRFGLAGLNCTVSGWQMSEDMGVDLDLIEDDESVYSFSASDLKALDSSPQLTVLNNASVPPTKPTGITANAGADLITLSWQRITDSDFLYVEVWENETSVTNPESDAARIMEVYGNTWTRNNLPGATTRYYWLRTVDRFGNRSTFTDPISATTTGDENIVLILE